MKTVRVSDIDLKVLDRGQGPPILLVHGFPLDHSMWNAQIDWLSATYRVIAPDLRGCGGSQSTSGKVTIEQFADDLAAVLDALDVREPVMLCGLSMGGYVAFQFWRKYRARLAALVLCDTRSAADDEAGVQQRMKMAEHVRRAGTEYVAEAMLPRLFAPQAAQRMPDVVESVKRRILAASMEGIIAALHGLAERPDVTGRLGEIDVPTLVIVGEHDVISPPDEMRRMAEAIPNAELAIIRDAGHLTPLENPTDFQLALANFLRRLDKTAPRTTLQNL